MSLKTRLARLRFDRALDAKPRDDLVHMGSNYGGYVVPLSLLGANSTCYSCGVGEDVTFDLDLIAATGCTVRAFDPTPRAAEYAARIADLEPRFIFLPYGIWSKDETMRFYAPREKAHVSHSIDNLQHTESYFEAECLSLASVMAQLGDETIDLLKLDVEGAEYEILRNVVEAGIDVRVVCAEFHVVTSVRDMISEVRSLIEAGFTPVHAETMGATFVATALGSIAARA